MIEPLEFKKTVVAVCRHRTHSMTTLVSLAMRQATCKRDTDMSISCQYEPQQAMSHEEMSKAKLIDIRRVTSYGDVALTRSNPNLGVPA
jgi:hypothetical protein